MLICQHLTPDSGEAYAWFTGNGADYFAACSECAGRYPSPPEALVTAGTDLLDALARPLIWGGVRGAPVARHRDTGLHFIQEDFPCAFPVEAPLIDVVPDPARARVWMGLTQSGYVLRLDVSERKSRELYRLADLGFAIDDEVALYVSPRSDFGCICQTSGQFGLVFDLTSGAITCRLDRGDYRPENSRFPFAFFESEGQTLVVTGTDWNRLDIINPANGAVLTERGRLRTRRVNSGQNDISTTFTGNCSFPPTAPGSSTMAGSGAPMVSSGPGISRHGGMEMSGNRRMVRRSGSSPFGPTTGTARSVGPTT